MKLIYCANGNARLADIAIQAGYHYGAQLPGTIYRPIYFADQDWKRPDRAAYMAALAYHRPAMATVLDWERPEQLPEVLDWAEETAQWVDRVLLIPKVIGAIGRLPRAIGGKSITLAYSVPTRFGGTACPVWEFAGWPIHLLGGSPQAQQHAYQHLQGLADVQSADGNYAQKMAVRWGQFWVAGTATWARDRYWPRLRETGEEVHTDVPYEAWRRSCINIIAAWQTLTSGCIEIPPPSETTA